MDDQGIDAGQHRLGEEALEGVVLVLEDVDAGDDDPDPSPLQGVKEVEVHGGPVGDEPGENDQVGLEFGDPARRPGPGAQAMESMS